jgi:hypothetical protein
LAYTLGVIRFLRILLWETKDDFAIDGEGLENNSRMSRWRSSAAALDRLRTNGILCCDALAVAGQGPRRLAGQKQARQVRPR